MRASPRAAQTCVQAQAEGSPANAEKQHEIKNSNDITRLQQMLPSNDRCCNAWRHASKHTPPMVGFESSGFCSSSSSASTSPLGAFAAPTLAHARHLVAEVRPEWKMRQSPWATSTENQRVCHKIGAVRFGWRVRDWGPTQQNQSYISANLNSYGSETIRLGQYNI